MFASKSLEIVRDLELEEFNNCVNQYGATYHTKHEGYAILLEEVEEAESELNTIKTKLNEVWNGTKHNDSVINSLVNLALASESLCLEAAQINAVANKFLASEKKELD